MMKPETKYIVADFARAGFKMIDQGPGGFEGYGNVKGHLDEVDDIVLDGAFTDTLPDFLADGWIAPDHQWGVKDDLGIFNDAREDETGLYVVAEFHETDDAQRVRQKTRKRLDKGKSVRLSIGYKIIEARFVTGKEAVQYLKNPTPEEISRCTAKARVRLLVKLKLYEVSLVSVPANTASTVVSAKRLSTGKEIDIKGEYLGNYVEERMIFSGAQNLVDRLIWGVLWDLLYGEGSGMSIDDKAATMDAALDELKEYLHRFIVAILSLSDDAGSTEAKEQLRTELKNYIDLHQAQSASLAEATFIDHSEAVLAAAEGFVNRIKSIRDLRTKEGRTISQATSARLLPHAGKLKEIASDIEDLVGTAESADEPDLVGDTSIVSDGGDGSGKSLDAEARALEAQFLEQSIFEVHS